MCSCFPRTAEGSASATDQLVRGKLVEDARILVVCSDAHHSVGCHCCLTLRLALGDAVEFGRGLWGSGVRSLEVLGAWGDSVGGRKCRDDANG